MYEAAIMVTELILELLVLEQKSKNCGFLTELFSYNNTLPGVLYVGQVTQWSKHLENVDPKHDNQC